MNKSGNAHSNKHIEACQKIVRQKCVNSFINPDPCTGKGGFLEQIMMKKRGYIVSTLLMVYKKTNK